MMNDKCCAAGGNISSGQCDTRCSLVICVMIRGDLDPILREKRGIGEEQIFCHILHTNGPALIEFLNT